MTRTKAPAYLDHWVVKTARAQEMPDAAGRGSGSALAMNGATP